MVYSFEVCKQAGGAYYNKGKKMVTDAQGVV
jgi:hypothetical protein